ncbi:MAG TPA: tetratricopeptide repeat protein [Pyrinomonadaceae bacterium]|jgi:tetratricopeptide (TPR) repeat protein
MKVPSPRLLLFVALLAALASSAPRGARVQGRSAGAWLSVRSQNFLVEGEARERDLRRVAARLEEYRAAFSRLLPGGPGDTGVPTAVVVFPGDDAYAPFKPLLGGRTARNVAGYFQPNSDINYITVVLDGDATRDPATLVHEYTHLLVDNYFSAAPLWLKEGLAEFYSTARVTEGGRRLTLGEPPEPRVRELRARGELLPLATLFAVNQSSPFYSESGKLGLFYAQSWALVHYLSEVRGGARREGLTRFTASLADGQTVEDALRAAFGAGVSEIEVGLAAYVRAGRFRASAEEFARPLDFDARLSARPLAGAETLARLGDLLLHTGRYDEAEGFLTRALELDSKLAPARVSLGALRLRQGRHAEARELLERAAAEDPSDHLAHYHLADALHREGATPGDADLTPKDFEERTELIRSHLRRASELAPLFVEPYRLLAAVEMERGDRYAEAAALLRRASALAPRRADLVLMLAQAEMLGGRFDEARRLAEPHARRSADERMREQAAALVARIESRRGQAESERRRADETSRAEASEAVAAQPCDLPVRGGPQHKRLRFEGSQVCGRLAEIECADVGVVLRVETAGGTLRLRAEDLRGIRFITYTTAVKTGRLECGPRERADHVLVTYRSDARAGGSSDGQAVAVEFIPEDWNPR